MAEYASPPLNAIPQPTTTPGSVHDLASGVKLQSTPSNCGSASATEYLSSAREDDDDVSPSILADIQNHNTCTVETLLNGLLSLCLPEDHKHNPPTGLLDECLEAVLPICNPQDNWNQTKGKNPVDKEMLADGSALLAHLTDYCQQKDNEMQDYRPFVYAFNHALRALHKIDVPLRKSPKLSLLFHRNYPKSITATHNGHPLTRKPDIILVSLEAVQNAFSEGDPGTWDDHALHSAGDPPKNNFKWSDALSVGEFKRTQGKRLSLRTKYRVRPAKRIPPQDTKSGDLLAGEEFTEPSKETMPKSLNTAQVSCEPRQSERLAAQTAPSSASGSQKRKSDHGEGSSSKRTKMQPFPLKRLTPWLQSALYAAERLSHAIWISHVINLVVVDNVAHVWWYDNEGVIQSHGIDFIDDLPHFLVLLLCFERFTSREWGVIPTFKVPEHGDQCLLSFPRSPSLSTVDVAINLTDNIRDHFEIVGRPTQILPASSQSENPNPRETGNLKAKELVVKIYWAEGSRVGEGEIIEKAHQIASEYKEVDGHIPDLFCSHDFEEYSTERIRMALGIKSDGHCLLRVMLFRRLYPITDLTGDKFWNAFWDCHRCHRRLWEGGVEHNDISVKNLMYDKVHGDRGILNDYDLAHIRGQVRPSGLECTGTMPFMALDLLACKAWKEEVKRLYRHDCESFAWVLVWICCRYDNGKVIPNPPLDGFITDDYRQCFLEKHAILSKLREIKPTPSYKCFWNASVALIKLFVRQQNAQEDPGDDGNCFIEPKVHEMVEKCRNTIKGKTHLPIHI